MDLKRRSGHRYTKSSYRRIAKNGGAFVMGRCIMLIVCFIIMYHAANVNGCWSLFEGNGNMLEQCESLSWSYSPEAWAGQALSEQCLDAGCTSRVRFRTQVRSFPFVTNLIHHEYWRSISPKVKGHSMNLTAHHPLLVPGIRMHGVIPPFHNICSWCDSWLRTGLLKVFP